MSAGESRPSLDWRGTVERKEEASGASTQNAHKRTYCFATFCLSFRYSQKFSTPQRLTMHARSFLTILIIAFCALSSCGLMALASPPPAESPLLKVTSPGHNSLYHVGDEVEVKVAFVGGSKNVLLKENTQIEFIIQEAIPLPELNDSLGSISAKKLAKDGFKFKVDKKFLITLQSNVPFRVRAHFDGSKPGYDDSAPFHIKE